ncbi:hypothetical protein Bca4012_031413 [Brassica carinata]
MMTLTVHSREPRSKRRRSQHKFEPYRGYIAEHPNDEEEVEGIDLHQQRYPWEGSDMDYLYDEAQAGNICVAAFDSTCSGICRSADPIVEVNMQCVDLEIIIWKLHFEAFPQHINIP